MSNESRLEALERENRALRRANAKLLRERIGSSNTAASSRLATGFNTRRRSALAIREPLANLRRALRRLLLRVLR